MEDGVSTTLKLNNIAWLAHDNIDIRDKKNYSAKLKFGKRAFELTVYDSTGNYIYMMAYTLKNGSNYFKSTKFQSDGITHNEEYTLDTSDEYWSRTATVTFTKESYSPWIVSVSIYEYAKDKSKKLSPTIFMGFGSLNNN